MEVGQCMGRPRLATSTWTPEPAPNYVWSCGWPPSFTTHAIHRTYDNTTENTQSYC